MNNRAHHWAVLKQALRDDRQRRRDHVRSADTEFLPAALEVIEEPVSPTARFVAWAAMLLLAISIFWAVFGDVDVVASAPGTLKPTGNVKLVQSAEAGIVRAIHVRNGDVVRQGQPLIDLDPTLVGADLAQAEKALGAAELEIARNRALVEALSGGGLRFVVPPGTLPEVVETQHRLIAAQLAEIEATGASLSAARMTALSDAAAARAQVAKLSDTLPLLDRQIERMNRLDAKGYAPGQRLIELQRQRRAEVGERDVALTQITRGEAEARKLASQLRETRQQARRTALLDLVNAEADAILRREEVVKARQKNAFQRLFAPAEGTIHQIAVHTIGGVVEPAKPLMVIVPSTAGLEVEARILNKDVGFVRLGQEVSVKLEAFPFTRYGAVPGRVRAISRDAVQDEDLGLVYIATITLERSFVDANNRRYPLSPGLTAIVDIHTGTRKIADYLLSPLQTTIAQSGRER